MAKRLRDYQLALLLLLGSVVLILVIATQWLGYKGKQAGIKRMLATKVETRLEAPKEDVQHVELPGLDEYQATLDRPLFMEGRRPLVEEPGEPEAAPVEKKPLTMKLMGVVFAPRETLGLFVDEKGKYKRLRPNDTISGWKLEKIESDKALMEQDGAHEVLRLAKPKGKKGAGSAKPGLPQPPIPAPVPGPFVPAPPQLGQPMPPLGVSNPNFPEEPIEAEQPNNEVVDETAIPSEEPQNAQ